MATSTEPTAPTLPRAIVRWHSTDRRGDHRGGGVEYARLGELVSARFEAGDRSLVATIEGREVAWIGLVDGRRALSYEHVR